MELGQPAAIAETLELLAEAVADEDAALAARLLGHAEQVRRERDLPRTQLQQRRLDRWRPALDETLGSAWARAAQDGRLRAAEELLAEAALLTAPPPGPGP